VIQSSFVNRRSSSGTDGYRIHDLRRIQHFTLKENSLSYAHLEDFVAVYNADNRHARTETERFKRFTYDELVARDKGEPRHLLAP
jgi:type I restriction enzyme M protein